ncbi:MAG TPA: DUF3558 domain-containing protein [Umezawaea sp.]|nr:DUF3558 domain-containing protein [Umezawaea sp.]
MRRYLVVAICFAMLTACTNTEGGTASPRSSTMAPATSHASSSTPSAPSSSRPREVRLDGKKPCELMTAEQLAAIAPTTAPRANTASTFNSPNCDFNATGASWRITTVTTEGVEAWTTGKRQGQPTEIPPIAGFPAITVSLPTDKVACDIAIDVADGQYLYAGFEVRESFADKFPKPCDGARMVAEAAMQNLTK